MTTLQTGDDCQSNDSNNLFPIDSLPFPLDSSMQIVFSGYYNGFSVEVRSVDEMALLYHMGCFGKGTFSRSKPLPAQSDPNSWIMRKRQFLIRNYWYKKFGAPRCSGDEGDAFLKEVAEVNAKLKLDNIVNNRKEKKDVIDLVSSDEDMSDDGIDDPFNKVDSFDLNEKGDIVVIVPDSDSEDDNYFANLKPKYSHNKTKLQEKLMLTLQEAFFLQYALGCLQIISLDSELLSVNQCWDLFTKTDKDFIPKYVIYHYYRSKGYIVKPGIKFGGDYLLYKEGPDIAHADYIVVVKLDQDKYEWISILGHVRMAATTVKEVIIAEVIKLKTDSQLPEELNTFSVREVLLNRKIPVVINEELD